MIFLKKIILKIAFDGTEYHGWQIQPNCKTVQSVLQDALETMLKKKTIVTGCSRTDAGVHAKEFYCHFMCGDNVPDEAFLKGLNSLLPKDIAVLSAEKAEDEFHARYSCLKKTYIYNYYFGTKDPFKSRYSVNIKKKPNLAYAEKFCKSIIGTHDFIAFSGSKRSVESTVRTIYDCRFERNDNDYKLTVTGDGFLYNMVRIIAGSAYEAGCELKSPDMAKNAFNSLDRNELGITFPPQGLILYKVYY